MRALFTALLLCSALQAQDVRVLEVLDGNTFRDSQGRTITIRGASTPELDEYLGDKAQNFLMMALLDRTVRVTGVQQDSLGNLYAYVAWRDWDIGLTLVTRGYAQVAPAELVPTVLKRYNEAEQTARSRRTGVWATSSFLAPPRPQGVELSPPPPPRQLIREYRPAPTPTFYQGYGFGSIQSGAYCVGGT